MSVGETPQCANDSHASLPTAWQTTSLTGPAACTGCHYRGRRKTNIYPGKWFSGERLLLQTQELHSGSRRWCSPPPRYVFQLIPLVQGFFGEQRLATFWVTMPSKRNRNRKRMELQFVPLGILWLTRMGFSEKFQVQIYKSAISIKVFPAVTSLIQVCPPGPTGHFLHVSS